MNETRVPTVSVRRVTDLDSQEEIRERVNSLMESLTSRVGMEKGKTILIKPNLCLFMGFETGATVDPFVCVCIVEWLLDKIKPGTIYLAEADATHLDADLAFQILGWTRIFKPYKKVKILNLSKDELVEVSQENQQRIKRMSKIYMESDYVISLSKLKTHTATKITCNLKNLFGADPQKVKAVHHPELDDAICDIVSTRVPDLNIVDGIYGMEGNGPVNGLPKPVGLLIGSEDIVAADHLCAKIMGFNPKGVKHLVKAEKKLLGSSTYHIEGDMTDSDYHKFKFLPLWKTVFKGALSLVKKEGEFGV